MPVSLVVMPQLLEAYKHLFTDSSLTVSLMRTLSAGEKPVSSWSRFCLLLSDSRVEILADRLPRIMKTDEWLFNKGIASQYLLLARAIVLEKKVIISIWIKLLIGWSLNQSKLYSIWLTRVSRHFWWFFHRVGGRLWVSGQSRDVIDLDMSTPAATLNVPCLTTAHKLNLENVDWLSISR